MKDLQTLTTLVKEHKLSLSPNTIYQALLKKGVLIEVSYLSTTGSGKEKKFKQIVSKYIIFGKNKWTMHEFKTEPRFYYSKFGELVAIVINQLSDEIKGINDEL